MKKVLLPVAILAILMFTKADAQTKDPAMNRTRIGIGADFAFPLGDFDDRANFGAGGSILYQNPVTQSLNITGNVGFIRFNGKKTFAGLKYREGFVPIKAGARYFIAENFYAGAEAGIAISTANGSGTGTRFIYSPGLGVEFPVADKGSVDLGVKYEGWARSNGTISFAGIRAGYNF